MCTVTFLPKGNGNFILTSNRDETPNRKTLAPQKYNVNGVELVFPKDELAGGTWVGLSEKNRLICLLNGGFVKHKRKTSYKMSRGVIVKTLLTSENAVADIENFNFNEIEPFTIVLVDWNSGLEIHELVWTGSKKHFKKLKNEPHIWSSATLYTDEMKELRKKWFADWLDDNVDFNSEKIIEFHQDKTKGNPEISLQMKRELVETVSTTCIEKSFKEVSMQYIDYINVKATTITALVANTTKKV